MKPKDPSPGRGNRIGYIEGSSSIILNVALFLLKYWVGLRSGSIAIIADAWHTLSDSLTSLVVLISFRASSRPPDKEHPYGHGRVEIISALVIGVILGIVGFNLGLESINRFLSRQAASFGGLAVPVFVISVIAKEGIAQYAFWGARKLNSDTLRADGWHHRSDAIASLLILLGIFLGRYLWWIDGVLGVAVSLLIFYVTYGLLRDSVSSLIGEEPGEAFEQTLQQLVQAKVTQDIHVHHIHLHRYGHHRELTFHIELSPQLRLEEAHRVADSLEKVVNQELNMETTIHVEPRDTP